MSARTGRHPSGVSADWLRFAERSTAVGPQNWLGFEKGANAAAGGSGLASFRENCGHHPGAPIGFVS